MPVPGATPDQADLPEQARQAAVTALHLLDEPIGVDIAELVRLAAELCEVPTAMINVFNETLVHPLAAFGCQPEPSARSVALCRHAYETGVEVIAPDTRLEPRFSGDPGAAADSPLRFYASLPLTTQDGVVVGTLCAYDLSVHELDPGRIALLRALARQIVGIVQLRRALARAQEADDLLATSKDAYYSMREDGVVLSWNRAAEEIFGYSAEEAIGTEVTSLIVPDRFQVRFATGMPMMLDSPGMYLRVIGRRKDGTEVDLDLTAWPSRSRPGWHSIARDVTALVANEQEQAATRERWRVALESAPIGMVISDVTRLLAALTSGVGSDPAVQPPMPQVLTANRKFSEMVGHTPEEIIRIGLTGLTDPLDRERDLAGARQLLDGDLEVYRTDKRYLHADGHLVWARLTASLARTADRAYMISQTEDITAGRAAERARLRAESLLRIAFEHAPHGSAIIGVRGADRGLLLQVNPALITMTGRAGLTGASFASLLDDVTDVQGDFEELADGRRDLVELVCRLRAGGGHIYAQAAITLSRDADGRPEHALAQLRDITQQHAHEEWLTRHAKTDALTGLANRLAMRERLVTEIDALRAGRGALAVLMVDLDRFKLVNDTLGHEAGDDLLRGIADALVDTLPAKALAARLGGDEFVVIVPQQEPGGGPALVALITRAVNEVGAGMAARIGVAVTGSVGVTMTENPATAPEDLIRAADHAMYRTKRTRPGITSAL